MHPLTPRGIVTFVISGLVLIALFNIVMMVVMPQYRVWERGLAGKAELAQAEYNRQVTVLEAKAKMDSAKDLAEAEIIRAKGVATANQIIAESLKGSEAYLRYLWINALDGKSDRQIVYVPTEAGLPILEAGRLKQ